jgi:hypothetical protein
VLGKELQVDRTSQYLIGTYHSTTRSFEAGEKCVIKERPSFRLNVKLKVAQEGIGVDSKVGRMQEIGVGVPVGAETQEMGQGACGVQPPPGTRRLPMPCCSKPGPVSELGKPANRLSSVHNAVAPLATAGSRTTRGGGLSWWL